MSQEDHIGIVENDQTSTNFLSRALLRAGYRKLFQASNGVAALELFKTADPRLLIVSDSLLDMEVGSFVDRVRETPLIIVSDNDNSDYASELLEQGADDFLTKGHFSAEQLVARVEAKLRRAALGQDKSAPFFENDGLKIDFLQHLVTVDGRKIHLTPTEYRVLTFFAGKPNQVTRNEKVIDSLWGAVDKGTFRTNLTRLRNKLESDPANPCYIVNRYYHGYMMPKPESS